MESDQFSLRFLLSHSLFLYSLSLSLSHIITLPFCLTLAFHIVHILCSVIWGFRIFCFCFECRFPSLSLFLLPSCLAYDGPLALSCFLTVLLPSSLPINRLRKKPKGQKKNEGRSKRDARRYMRTNSTTHTTNQSRTKKLFLYFGGSAKLFR